MKRLVMFFRRIYVLLLFLALEAAAISNYADSTGYTRAKILTATNSIFGGVYRVTSGVGGYFRLRRENDALTERLRQMENTLERYRSMIPDAPEEFAGTGEVAQYVYMPARVIDNSVSRPMNFLTLDKGARDGVRANMAVVTPEGSVVGYVMEVSEKFAVAISILNTEFHTGGKIRGKDSFGSVWWKGTDHTIVTLSEIPRYSDIAAGDTIVTGYSSIFPEEVMIGTVVDYELTPAAYYEVRVRLATRMSSLRNVFLVDYADIMERQMLEEEFGTGAGG